MSYTPVGFTYGHPETLSPIACKTLLHNMGVGKVMEIDKMFDGSMTDKEIINKLAELDRTNPNIDKGRFADRYATLIAGLIARYFNELKAHDKVIADNPQMVEAIKAAALEASKNSATPADDKKKQLTEEN